MAAIAPLLTPQGTLLVVTRWRDHQTAPQGPPWPLSNQELALMATLGLHEVDRYTFQASEPPVPHLCVQYRCGEQGVMTTQD
jgi:hypothetical protein